MPLLSRPFIRYGDADEIGKLGWGLPSRASGQIIAYNLYVPDVHVYACVNEYCASSIHPITSVPYNGRYIYFKERGLKIDKCF